MSSDCGAKTDAARVAEAFTLQDASRSGDQQSRRHVARPGNSPEGHIERKCERKQNGCIGSPYKRSWLQHVPHDGARSSKRWTHLLKRRGEFPRVEKRERRSDRKNCGQACLPPVHRCAMKQVRIPGVEEVILPGISNPKQASERKPKGQKNRDRKP